MTLSDVRWEPTPESGQTWSRKRLLILHLPYPSLGSLWVIQYQAAWGGAHLTMAVERVLPTPASQAHRSGGSWPSESNQGVGTSLITLYRPCLCWG